MADEIDTGNWFLVAAHGDGKIHVMNPMPLAVGISRDRALNLASWLVAIADPSGERFAKVLEAVRNT